MSNQTIAIVINTSWNIYNFRLGLLNALREDGYRIIAIAPHDGYSAKLQALGFDYHDIKINNKGTNPLQDLLLIWSFFKIFRKLKPDLILQYTIKPNIYGTLAAKLAGIPTINNISGLGTVFLNNNISSRIARMLYRISLRFAYKVFFQNPHDRKLFIDNKLVKERKSGLLPGSGIDLDKFHPVETKKTADSPFVFLLIARMIKDKGVFEFVEAARRLIASQKDLKRGVEFWLLGDLYPDNPTAIKTEQIKQWQENDGIKYWGHSDDVTAYINQADCVVLPSYREGLSRVLLEAAALAKPIITTNVPGCKDVVDDGCNGFLCKLKDIEDLAKQLRKMLCLSDDDLREMGKQGRQKIEQKFDEKIVIKQYLEVIKQKIN